MNGLEISFPEEPGRHPAPGERTDKTSGRFRNMAIKLFTPGCRRRNCSLAEFTKADS